MDIWNERYRALSTLKSSLDYTITVANNIKKSLGTAEENIPERLSGYINAILRYQKTLTNFWGTIYNASEYYEAVDAESPKLAVPPSVSLDADGIPFTSRTISPDAPFLEDNEASISGDQSMAPGVYSGGSEVGLNWFGNLVNLMNNYVPETSKDWTKIWDLIRDGYGISTRTNTWVGMNWEGKPFPEFVGHPDLAEITTSIPKGVLICDQKFEYGKGQIGLQVYKTDRTLLFEVEIFGSSTMSSLPIVGEVLGKTYIDDEDIVFINNIKCPLLHRGYTSFEYGLFDLIFNVDDNNVLTLKLTGTGFTGSELACNCTYTVPIIFMADSHWSSHTDAIWGLGATKAGNLRQYFVSYSGGQPIPPPPPPPDKNWIGMDNIAECIFDTVNITSLVLSSDAVHGPTSYDGTKITYDKWGDIVFNKLVSVGFVLCQDTPCGPTTTTTDALTVESIGTAVLPQIRANKFILSQTPTIIAKEEEVVDTMDYMFDFKLGEISFSQTVDNSEQYPPSYKPGRSLMFGMHGNDTEGSIDVMNYFSEEDTKVSAFGLYAHAGNEKYTVHNYTGLHTTISVTGDPVWSKEADRFTYSIYRETGVLVYSFMADYTSKGLDTWTNGTHQIVSVGETPRNLCPQNHTIVQIGKCSYLIIMTNGSVKLVTENDEAIFEDVEFTGCAVATDKSKVSRTDIKSMPKISGRKNGVELRVNRFEKDDSSFDFYTIPSLNISDMTIDNNNGVCYMYNYQLGNLRNPIFDKDGDMLNTEAKIKAMYNNPKTRIKLGDGTVLRMLNMSIQQTGFTTEYSTGDIYLYFTVCEFLWAIPQIEHLIDESEENHKELLNILEDWDGLTIKEYFERVQGHSDNVKSLIDLANITAEDISSEAYAATAVVDDNISGRPINNF